MKAFPELPDGVEVDYSDVSDDSTDEEEEEEDDAEAAPARGPQCPKCMGDLHPAFAINCGHIVCNSCLDTARAAQDPQCPVYSAAIINTIGPLAS